MTTPHEAAPLRIVAVALQSRGAIISEPPPARHHNVQWTLARMSSDESAKWATQGFLASNGQFYTRRTALDIVHAAGQLEGREKTGDPSQLFSEDLW